MRYLFFLIGLALVATILTSPDVHLVATDRRPVSPPSIFALVDIQFRRAWNYQNPP
jgi:hypothetical protein